MKHYKEKTVKAWEIETIVCNMCGERIGRNSLGYLDEYLCIEKNWGYGSPYDGQTHQIDLCGACYDKLLGQLKHRPQAEEAAV